MRLGSNTDRRYDGTGVMAGYAIYIKGTVNDKVKCAHVSQLLLLDTLLLQLTGVTTVLLEVIFSWTLVWWPTIIIEKLTENACFI